MSVGNINIRIGAGTASLETDFARANRLGANAAQGIKSEFDKVDFHESRAGALLLNEQLGTHLPRHLTSLIATLPGVGAAFAAALPIIAVVVFVTKIAELVEHFKKVAEAAEKANNDQIALATSVNKAFDSLDEKLLRVGIQTDELNGRHLAALKKELELINKQSLSELASSFDTIAKAAENLFKDLTVKWYQFGIGSEGAKHALEQFQVQYESLLAKGDKTGASDLLKGTLDSAQKVLDFQKQYEASVVNSSTDHGTLAEHIEKAKNHEEASLALKKAGVGVTEQEVKSQQALVDTLKAQLKVQAEIKTLQRAEDNLAIKKDELANVYTAPAKSKLSTGSSHDANGAFLDVEETKKRADEKAALEAATELDKAHQFDIKTQAAINDELDRQRLKWDEISALNTKDVLTTQEHIIRMQEASGVITKRTADAKIAALYAQAEVDDTVKRNAELTKQLALVAQLNALTKGGTAGSDADKAAYSKAMADYQKFLLDKEKAKAASDAKINKAEEDAAAKTFAIQKRAIDSIMGLMNNEVQGLISGQESFSQAAQKAWQNFAQSAIMGLIKVGEERLIQHILGKALGEEDKLKDASAAARKVFKSAMELPFPINIAVAPVAAAGVFAAAMAFEKGGEVPDGAATGVPAILHPKEMVLDRALADVVRSAAANKSSGGTGVTHNNTFAPVIHVPIGADHTQFEKVLDKAITKWTRNQGRRHGIGN